jgi:hypothetical protein
MPERIWVVREAGRSRGVKNAKAAVVAPMTAMFIRRDSNATDINPITTVHRPMQLSVSTLHRSLHCEAGYQTRNCSTRNAYASKRIQLPRRNTFGRKISTRSHFRSHAIEYKRERNSNQKKENGSGKSAKELAQPKPFPRNDPGDEPSRPGRVPGA